MQLKLYDNSFLSTIGDVVSLGLGLPIAAVVVDAMASCPQTATGRRFGLRSRPWAAVGTGS